MKEKKVVKKTKPESPHAEKILRYKKWNATPFCFPSRKIYNEWKELAKTSNEVCSICTDCTAAYRFEMKQQNLCEHHIWSEIMFNQKKKDKEEETDNVL